MHELAASRLGLQWFTPLLRRKETAVRLMMDCMVNVYVVDNGTSQYDVLIRELRCCRRCASGTGCESGRATCHRQ